MPSPRERLVEALTLRPDVRLAVLFGSAARGTQGRGSDVDVGVSLGEDSAEALVRLEGALARALGCEVQVVSLDTSPPQLRFEIARDGVVLVEKEPYAWADFRARAMIDWWDWAPTARRIHSAAVARLREKTRRGTT